MNIGLFAMMAGFLLPLTMVIRLSWQLVEERWRGPFAPLNLFLTAQALAFAIPVAALAATAWSVVTGDSIEAGAMLLDFTASTAGLVKLAVTALAVVVADLAMPRVYAQLVQVPISDERPTFAYLARDLGVAAVCLGLAIAASFGR